MGAWLPSASWSSIFLLLLVGQNTSKTLLLRAAVHTSPRFLYSAAVLATEALKATLAAAWVLSSGGSPRSILRFLQAEWRNFLRVMVPAGIYNCQQMLEFVALSRLEAPVFSVIVQTKLLTTALFSVLLLGKQLRAQQMIALVLLMVGVILAQMKGGQKTLLDVTPDAFIGASATLCIATLSGFAAVYTERVLKRGQLRAHTHAQDILGYMQIQMALASLLIIGAPIRIGCRLPLTPPALHHQRYATLHRTRHHTLHSTSTTPPPTPPLTPRPTPRHHTTCDTTTYPTLTPQPRHHHTLTSPHHTTPSLQSADLLRRPPLDARVLHAGMFAAIMDMPTILEVGLWHGFDRAACIAVVSSALGGLIVSAVLKYADSVLKGYATAASVILTGVLSSMFLGTTLDLHFMLAVINVTCSIALYSQVGVASTPVISPSETEPLARGA